MVFKYTLYAYFGYLKQVAIWRRSFDIPPPPMEADHAYYDTIVKDPRYSEGPTPDQFPKFESLKLTIERTLPFWNETIVPQIKAGKQILIAAHGNSLRGIVKHLDRKLSLNFYVMVMVQQNVFLFQN